MAVCKNCNNEIVSFGPWCSICHSFWQDPSVGKLASPFKRLVATVLDGIVPFFVLSVFFGLIAGDPGGGGLALLALLLLLGYVVWALWLFGTGRSPGKWLLGMRVVREDGRSANFLIMLMREWIGKFISGMFFGLGYLWILFDRDRQGWHDKLLNTYVVG